MSWTLYEGDCLQVMRGLPAESVEAVIADPPYGLGESKLNWQEKGYRRISEAWDSEVPTDWIVEAVRLLKPGGSFLCFVVWKTIETILNATREAGLDRRDIIVWDKVNTMPNITAKGYQFSHELIVYCTKGGNFYWGAEKQVRDILRHTWSQGERWHPCQKPVPVMAELIRNHVPPGGTVIDPFAGSGATLAAAEALGRNSIGIELDANHAARIRRRMDEATRQVALFA